MLSARPQALRLFLLAITATLVVWSQGAVAASASPSARAAKQCQGPDKAQCQADNQRREHLEQLREQNAHQKRPNVIVIQTDDQNVGDMFVMQQTLALLGARGTSFDNSYVSYPLCCPSRATFLTGQYAHNHRVLTDQRYGDLDNSNTLAVWMRQAKYRTALVGKYVNGYGVVYPREIPPGWTQWFALTGGTDQKRYRYNLNENGKLRYYRGGARNYVTDVLSSKVNLLLKQWTPSPKPFFLYFAPTAPHGERAVPVSSSRDPEPAPRHLGTFGDILNPRTPNYNEEDVSDKPEAVRKLPLLSDADLADLDRRYRGRLESLLSVDDEVKKIVGLVRKYGDKRKTFFVFTSDNGLEMGAHRIKFKNYLYEEGERVPLIIRGPGFPAGVTRQQLVSNIDLAPTITALTGAQPARVMDGIPLLPLAKNPAEAANRDLLFESFDLGESNFQEQAFGIRRGQWAYNEYAPDDGGALYNHAELYNLNADPYELNNLLYDPLGPTDPSPADLVLASQLSARLAQLKTCSGASCN
ncbi:MAG: sulfatase [Solirubrobacterales bacterium]